MSISTSKTLEEAEQILKNMGMEIVLKSEYATITFDDLSNEEKVAWINFAADGMNQMYKRFERDERILKRARANSTRYLEEIRRIMEAAKDDLTFDVRAAIKELNKRRVRELKNFVGIREAARWMDVYYLETFQMRNTIHSGCIIAKTDSNIVRYLNFVDDINRKDPILTVIGQDAETILATCRNNF